MRVTIRRTVTERREQGLEAFLFAGSPVSEVCGQQKVSPGALLLDNLVANRGDGETFKNWLARQAAEVLAQQVQTDDWQEGRCTGLVTRVQCAVEGIQLSADDRQWILERYGRHPEVLAVWEQACRNAHPAQQAA